MRILITGAYGFIGQYVAASLRAAGHHIVAAVRHPERWHALYPQEKTIACDFNLDVTVEIWEPRLQDIDAVINCVGILQQQGKQSIAAIHYLTPKALFDACRKQKVRIIHLSALGADKEAPTPYAQTKRAAEDYLQGLDSEWLILRPSLVYATGSSGGTSLFRALAGMFWRVPLVGTGQQLFQPIFVEDLARAIAHFLEHPAITRQCFDAVGPERVTVKTLTGRLREWLRFGKPKFIYIPLPLIAMASRLGDWLGTGPLNSTSYKMLQYGNITSSERQQAFFHAIAFQPRSMTEVLAIHPSQQQDRWHARLYFLQPLLRLSIALVWILSGLLPLMFSEIQADQLLALLGVPEQLITPLFYAASAWDIALGFGALFNWRIKLVAGLQLMTLLAYTVICSLWLTELWLDPFGPLLKNIPLLMATLLMAALDD